VSRAVPSAIVAIDGAIVPPEHAAVSVFDRGFLYGDAVFEVFRTYRGVPFALDQHLARLARSAELTHIAMPVDAPTLAAEIARALDAARAGASSDGPHADWYVRLMLTRGGGAMGLDPDLADEPTRVLIVAPLGPPARDAYARGIGVAMVATTRAVDGTTAAGAKVTSWLASILALREAKSRGAAEALIVDARGEVVEGASSNVFVVKSGALSTPPESAGILAGITRAHVVASALERGVVVHLAPVVPAELFDADEIFVTSSIREIFPVVEVDGKAIGGGAPGALTRSLHRDLRVRAGVGDLPMPWE
jgi:branched-chain amino acid aminotransferase